MRQGIVALALLLLLTPAHAQDPAHLVLPTASTSGATTLNGFDRHIENSAGELHQQYPGASIARYAGFDSAAPRDAAEYEKLGGYGVVLVAAISHDGSELPLARVYLVRADGTQVPLLRIGTTMRQVAPSSLAAAMFGANRQDAFYLLPESALAGGAQLLCDFARNRAGFPIARLNQPDKFKDAAAAAAPPSRSAVQALLDREYPDLGIVITEGVP